MASSQTKSAVCFAFKVPFVKKYSYENFFEFYNFLIEEQSGRPVVGIIRFNLLTLDYKKDSFRSHIATFLQGLMRAVFFHPVLFYYYYPKKLGEKLHVQRL